VIGQGVEDSPESAVATVEAKPVPLRRNRNYGLLWAGQMFSETGFNTISIAFPLLVLVLTGSAAASGLVLGASAAAQLVAGLPAGVVADRHNRRTVMLICEAVQTVGTAGLVVALALGHAQLWMVVVVAAVAGVGRSFFEPAERASLPQVVPAALVGEALAANAARGYLGQLSGTALGGLVFAFRRYAPFLLDAVLHALCFVLLLFLRLPKREPRPVAEPGRVLAGWLGEMGHGLAWVWRQRLLRATALCLVGVNFFFTAFYVVIIVVCHQRGLPSGEIGVMGAMFGVGGLLGALAAPTLLRRISPYFSVLGVLWALTVLTPVAVLIDNAYLMGVLLAAMAFLAPTANTSIGACQLLLTPDGMRGRLSSVLNVLGGLAAAAGPAVGGWLAGLGDPNRVILICSVGILVLAVLGSISPALRTFPSRAALLDARPDAGDPEITGA
jgi:MFS family permease